MHTTNISAGIDKLKTCIRIWWKIDGKRHRETLHNTPPTPENLKTAQATADMIAQQLRMGIFDRNQVFPNSPKRPQAYFDYYIRVWETTESATIAPSSWRTYKNKMQNHIEPYWGKKQIAKITTEQVEHWVYKILIKKLAVKTIKDLLMIFRAIWSYWARHERNPKDPTQYIKLSDKDSDDINPYNRREIDTIINTETDPALKNLWTVMLWSGLSTHELIPLAVEDLDLANGYLYVKRGYVDNTHKATKNRRRRRQIELLPNVVAALQSQCQLVQHHKPDRINVLQRDNISYSQQSVTWLWYNPDTKTHYTYKRLETLWKRHLAACRVTYRPLNNGRHTYASQVLSTGAVTAEWLANQLGHADTSMIHKHYGKFIPQDAKHIIHKLDNALNQS
ncbi:Arm DNA-binding domain-containing protein [Moraxella atlantae]|uniref:Site-specific recombinase XerD n=1 Tax=Faucicola atlantae TaxID=34059 RepID=A0A378Q2Q6_9GAMM|nr:DUF3596 domain-containing protein [Moraxella atlantae]OPH35193.1 hypothetical protein B5J92_05950 [Moraxella atlantae]STY95090.1 Site-specific recombinase XerD [Moraxella atlantae]